MQLLVSVANGDEAAAALAGGADIIDAKDPRRGALGAVRAASLAAIVSRVGGIRPLSAALGDDEDADAVERAAARCAAAGVAFVKIGFARTTSQARVANLLAAARRSMSAVVAVAYADGARIGSIDADALVDAAARAGATGVLLDTADKTGPGLCELMNPAALRAWVTRARSAGLQVALAGRLRRTDLAIARDAGADIAGVRGAACEGGRTGTVTSARVRELVDLVRADHADGDARRQRTVEVRVDELAG